MVCDEIPECKDMMDKLAYNNPNQLSIQLNFDKKFDEKEYNKWLQNTSFHKLTYKGKYHQEIDGMKTFYGFILNS